MTTLSPAVLAEARETLTQIYHAAGIGVQWKTIGADFTVFVISRPPPAVHFSPASLSDMCRATTPSAAVTHLSSRIALGTIERACRFLDLVLGLTMAHEVAHLLLPYESHSVDGLMRSAWNTSDYWKARLGQLLFTDEEAQLMRDRLSAEPVRTGDALRCQEAVRRNDGFHWR